MKGKGEETLPFFVIMHNVFLISLKVLLRNRFLFFLALCVVLPCFAAWLAYLFGGRQPATTALDVGLSVLRLVLPFLIVFGTQDLVHREFERKFYCASMSYPLSRSRWLLGRFFAMLLAALASLLLASCALALLVKVFALAESQATAVSLGEGYWITVAFIAVDLVVLLAVAMLLAVVASTASFVLLGTLGFMLIARTYAAIVALLGADSGLVAHADFYRANLGGLEYLLPDLGALDVRMIALYGRLDFLPGDWALSLAGALAYALGFLALAVWAFQRKRMS